MTTTGMIGLLLLAGLAWGWFDAMRALEKAREAARLRCEALGLSLLDDTVVLKRLRLRRNGNGQLTTWREYRFEFSGDGHSRHHGRIIVLGGRVQSLDLDPWRVEA